MPTAMSSAVWDMGSLLNRQHGQRRIGMDKEEIIRISRKIGTFDTSILPYEDCCTVFTPRHPKTKPHVEEVRELEAVLDIDALCDRAMAGREFVRIKF